MYRKKSSSSNPPFVDGKHNMTCLQLCEGDDLATMMTVDAVLGFTTHKMDKNYNPSLIDKKVRERWREIMREFISDHNYENAYNQLIASDKIKSSLKKDERFKRHIFRFLYLFDKRSGIEVTPCYRYENEGRKGAAIFATREWEKGSQISTLFGCIAEMSPSEEEIFHESKNEFSVMYSTRKNCSQLWLGPAAYVNHDCKPNCRFTEGNDDSKMTLETLRDIHPGDELLIYYGNNFFGIDNAECECFTCELRDKGLFSRHFQSGIAPPSLPSTASDYGHESKRQIVTRSTKMIPPDHSPHHQSQSRLSLSQSFHGALGRLKRSEDTYSLRVTYSRIDRVKKRILSRTFNTVDSDSPQSSNNVATKPNLKSHRSLLLRHKPTPTLKPKATISNLSKPPQKLTNHTNTEPLLPQRRSKRHLNSQSGSLFSRHYPSSLAATTDHNNRWGKLTIKLRKNASHPHQYEQIDNPPPLPTPCSDSNIFSRITQLYLLQTDPISALAAVDTPPSLSPWFSTHEKAPSIKSQHPKPVQQRPKAKLKPCRSSSSQSLTNHRTRPIIVNNNNNCCETSSDECVLLPETTSSSDIPSYDTTSPTIPVLEIESETELAPPHLVCELFEPELTNSPNKGIVMKFSRISGNKFASLLS